MRCPAGWRTYCDLEGRWKGMTALGLVAFVLVLGTDVLLLRWKGMEKRYDEDRDHVAWKICLGTGALVPVAGAWLVGMLGDELFGQAAEELDLIGGIMATGVVILAAYALLALAYVTAHACLLAYGAWCRAHRLRTGYAYQGLVLLSLAWHGATVLGTLHAVLANMRPGT